MNIAFCQSCVSPSFKMLISRVEPAAGFSNATGTKILEPLLHSLDHERNNPCYRALADDCARHSLSNLDGLRITVVPGFRALLHRLQRAHSPVDNANM